MKQPLIWSRLYLLTILLLLTGCTLFGWPTEQPQETPMNNNSYLISTNTAFTWDDQNLRIGTGNFWREEYTDEQGETVRGTTAGLWLWVLDETLENQAFRVHAGQTVPYGPYNITINEIGQGNQGYFVRVTISTDGKTQ